MKNKIDFFIKIKEIKIKNNDINYFLSKESK